MATATKARKQKAKPRFEISSDKARDVLGGLVTRAGTGDERVVFTRHGLAAAALVSIDDLRRLEEGEAA
jgi:prevent-host-death family protein